jgi:hypothetical protein
MENGAPAGSSAEDQLSGKIPPFPTLKPFSPGISCRVPGGGRYHGLWFRMRGTGFEPVNPFGNGP